MKALVKTDESSEIFKYLEVPSPVCGPDEVIVKVKAAGICGTDLKILHNQYPYKPPMIPGHEFTGVIVEVGQTVTGFQIGDRVTAEMIQVSCRSCPLCRQGHYALCNQRRGKGMLEDGAFAEYVSLKADYLYKLPDKVSFESGVLLEPLSCVVHGLLEEVRLNPGDKVLVIGLGAIGLLAAQTAMAYGSQVIACSRVRQIARNNLARRFGITVVTEQDPSMLAESLTEFTEKQGFDGVIDCAGSESAVDLALQTVKKRGWILQLGMANSKFPVDFSLITKKELTLHGALAHTEFSWRRSIQLVEAELIQLKPMVSATFPLVNWEEAFRVASSGNGIKIIFNT